MTEVNWDVSCFTEAGHGALVIGHSVRIEHTVCKTFNKLNYELGFLTRDNNNSYLLVRHKLPVCISAMKIHRYIHYLYTDYFRLLFTILTFIWLRPYPDETAVLVRLSNVDLVVGWICLSNNLSYLIPKSKYSVYISSNL